MTLVVSGVRGLSGECGEWSVVTFFTHLTGVHEVQEGGQVLKLDAGEVDDGDFRVLTQHIQKEAGA